jgi:hypothetical protein
MNKQLASEREGERLKLVIIIQQFNADTSLLPTFHVTEAKFQHSEMNRVPVT